MVNYLGDGWVIDYGFSDDVIEQTHRGKITEKSFEDMVAKTEKAFGEAGRKQKLLIDARESFPINPGASGKVARESNPRLFRKGCKKMAMLISDDAIVNISVDHFINADSSGIEIKKFHDKEDALSWLKK